MTTATQLLELAFNPDQPRDRTGKWSSNDVAVDQLLIKPEYKDHVSVLHTTTAEQANTILAKGFNPLYGSRVGAKFGNGIYASFPTRSGLQVQGILGHQGDTQLRLDVGTNNPLRVDPGWEIEQDAWVSKLYEQAGTDSAELIVHSKEIEAEAEANWHEFGGRGDPSDASSEQVGKFSDWLLENKGDTAATPFVDFKAQALRETVISKGYDSIVYTDRSGADSMGDMIVAMHPEQVTVMDYRTVDRHQADVTPTTQRSSYVLPETHPNPNPSAGLSDDELLARGYTPKQIANMHASAAPDDARLVSLIDFLALLSHRNLQVVASAEFAFDPDEARDEHGRWTYTYEVQYAEDHAAMAKAEYKTTHVRVQADSEPEANLIAAQMGGRHGIPTQTKLVKREEFAYDPDEERDSGGRWTSHGDGGQTQDQPSSDLRQLQDAFPNAYLDLDTMNPKALSVLSERAQVFASDYPGAAGAITSIVMDPSAPEEEPAWTDNTWGESTSRLGFSPAFFSADYDENTKRLDEIAAEQGFHMYPSQSGIFDHEFGHVLDNYTGSDITQALVNRTTIGGKDIDFDHVNEIIHGLGGYATTSPGEAWAEAFAQERLGYDHLSDEMKEIYNIGLAYSAQGADKPSDQLPLFASGWAPLPPGEKTCKGYFPKRAVTAAIFLDFFSEDEPRDANGRWTSGGEKGLVLTRNPYDDLEQAPKGDVAQQANKWAGEFADHFQNYENTEAVDDYTRSVSDLTHWVPGSAPALTDAATTWQSTFDDSREMTLAADALEGYATATYMDRGWGTDMSYAKEMINALAGDVPEGARPAEYEYPDGDLGQIRLQEFNNGDLVRGVDDRDGQLVEAFQTAKDEGRDVSWSLASFTMPTAGSDWTGLNPGASAQEQVAMRYANEDGTSPVLITLNKSQGLNIDGKFEAVTGGSFKVDSIAPDTLLGTAITRVTLTQTATPKRIP